MSDFTSTGHARRLFDVQIPRLIQGIDRIASALEKGCTPMPGVPTPVRRPLTAEQLKAVSDQDGCVRVVVGVPFAQLLYGNIEDLNDFASETITGSVAGLSDISYRVTGGHSVVNTDDTCGGEVLIEVTGIVDVPGMV